MSASEREKTIAEREKAISTLESDFKTFVEGLQKCTPKRARKRTRTSRSSKTVAWASSRQFTLTLRRQRRSCRADAPRQQYLRRPVLVVARLGDLTALIY